MATFTDSTTNYAIDKLEEKLDFTFLCNFPCSTCRADDPDYCLSCNYFDEYLILYDGKCSPNCPERTYKEAYNCYPCDDKCKTCASDSGSTCLSCWEGDSDFPFLYGNTCVDQCVDTYYGDRDTAKCEKC